MTVRNVLLLGATAFWAFAFATMSSGCLGYQSEDNVTWSCIDPSGVGPVISQAAHLLFAGLGIMSVALLDHRALWSLVKDLR